jgi:hypothetical protein
VDRVVEASRGGLLKTYALLHEGVDLALILNVDELLAAIGRVGNVQLERDNTVSIIVLVVLLKKIGWRVESFDDEADTRVFLVDRAIRVVRQSMLQSSRDFADASCSPVVSSRDSNLFFPLPIFFNILSIKKTYLHLASVWWCKFVLTWLP